MVRALRPSLRAAGARAGSPRSLALLAAGVAVAALAVVVARGLGGPGAGGPGPGGGAPRERPVAGGTLRTVLGEDVVLDPQRSSRPASWLYVRALHRGLMAFPPAPHPEGSRPVPDLAEGPPVVSGDGRRYEFRLRDGARFGPPADRALRAADVRAGIERLLKLRTDVSRSFLVIEGARDFAAGRAERVSGIRTPDARTVVIVLERRANDLPWMLALPQASAIPAELGGAVRLSPRRIAPSGPYRIAAWEPERSLRLERNPAWREGSDPVRGAHVDAIEARIGVPVAEALEEVAAGRADLAPDAGLGAEAPPGAPVSTAPGACLRYVFMNTTVAPFDDVRVRRAVAAAIDREAVAGAGAPEERAAWGILPPVVFGWEARDPDAAVPEPDPERARSLLRRAGHPGGISVPLVAGASARDRAQAEALRVALARAGIRADIRPVPLSLLYTEYFERPERRVAMGLASWCADWPGLGGRRVIGALLDGRLIRSSGNTVSSMLADRALQSAIDRALAARELDVAIRRWERAEERALGTAAIVPLTWPPDVVARSERLRGFAAHPFFAAGDPTSVWVRG